MSGLTKEEYLKKYLSGDEATKKKKKRRPKSKTSTINPRLKIVDDDVDFKSLLPENINNTLEEDVGDDDPTVAEVVDERPEEVIRLEEYRKNKRWKTLESTKTKRHDSDSDESPYRNQRHDSDSDQSPPRKQRHDSDSDQSPPRKQRHDSDSDQSPPRRTRHDSDSDQSPPRRLRHDSDSDQSPPRKKLNDSDSDQSPPRRKRHVSDSDQSPPRKKRHDSDSDQSPPRRKKNGVHSDRSPPRSKKFSKSNDTNVASQEVKQRRRKSRFHSDSDNTPTRPNSSSVKIKSEQSPSKDKHGRPQKTLGGATAGLSSAKQMREEAKMMKKREDEMFSKLDDSILGRNAKTVFRDRKKKTEEELQEEEEAEARKAERELKYKAWNKGLKQNQLQAEAAEAAVREMGKSLARHQGDEDLEDHLKAQDREGDPMLAFIKKKNKKDPNKKELPKYKGPQPPMNRFNIWPGYRWDGVDRSNGFEKMIVAKASEKKAIKEIAYKWSVEDM